MTTGRESLMQGLERRTPARDQDTDTRVVMTLRVSRDSGRTWGPRRDVRAGNDRGVPVGSWMFPPCTCPRCAGRSIRTAL